MLDQLTTSEGTLVLVSRGAALEAVADVSHPDLLLWARGPAERRVYGRTPDARGVLLDGDDEPAHARRLGAEFRERGRFDADLAAALGALDEIQLPFSDAALVARVAAVLGRERRFRRGDVALRDLREPLGALRLAKSSDAV